MKVFVVFCMTVAVACSAALDDSSKKDKRGIYDLGYGHSSQSYDNHHESKQWIPMAHAPAHYSGGHEKHVPYPVEVEKKVVVEKHIPYVVVNKVPYHVDRPVPYPVEVKVPVVQKEYIEVPKPYAVHVEKHVPVYIDKPVYIEKPVPVSIYIKQHKKHWGWF